MGDVLSMFPLSTVLFPHATLALHVFENRYRLMINECLHEGRSFGVVLISRGSEVGGGESRVAIGTSARIENTASLPQGRFLLQVRGEKRFHVVDWLPDDPYPRGVVEWIPEPAPSDTDVAGLVSSAAAAVRRCRALLSELHQAPPAPPDAPDDPDAMSWWLCEQAPVTVFDRQRLLECVDLRRRLGMVAALASDVSEDLVRLLANG